MTLRYQINRGSRAFLLTPGADVDRMVWGLTLGLPVHSSIRVLWDTGTLVAARGMFR